MANENTLNVRFQLKYDTLAAWSAIDVAGQGGNLILEKGEIAFVEVPTGSDFQQTAPPAIVFKVGNGTSAFKDLPWGSALSADVYDWAKKSSIEIKTTGSGTVVSGISWDATNNRINVAKGITPITAITTTSGGGLTATKSGSTYKVDIDTGALFVLDCGTSTKNV